MINDEKIIELFFERSEQGIREPDMKYGKICHNLSYNIVNSRRDAEECVNDAYLGAWNAIPPVHPNPLSNLHFNEIEGFSDAARIWFDPALYDTDVAWGKDEVTDYYGKDLTPLYIPDGLVAASGNGTAKVILDKNGKVIYDTIWLDFYHDYYEDGSPKLTEDVAALKGFSITVSKIGLLNDCCYILPENEVKTSDIDGTVVTFGYRSMPYGPYNPDTHEPSGYYDMYVAEFEYDGIEYQIVAEQMEAEEVVKVVSSIIYGEEVIVDK